VSKNATGLVCLLEEQARHSSEQAVLLGSKQLSLSYADLKSLASTTNRSLIGAGLQRGDRVALVISNGPEAATAFLSIAAGHICAPLNPAYRASEFEFYFSDLKPKAIIIEAGLENAAAGVASSLGIPVIYLCPDRTRAAGIFTLDTGLPLADEPDFADAGEVALVLHTSGTTSRPKIVPLTHANLLDNARNIARSLQLTSQDRCLNVMPLFHVHGLIGAVLSSLSAGASVFCSSGFQVAQFFSWFDDCRPSWYTAVPTMHQAILTRAAQANEIIAKSQLRFIRSCSSALPPQVMAELEEAFHVPVVEAYGMTEASHQMACNPLPPAARKPGSVGIATGPEIAIMSAEGDLPPATTTGEIVIRGVNVTAGYDNNPDANAGAFQQGWFRTGDQGYLDADGYLFINGRTKEMINRGGEKICPREIDEALMDHPAVRQAVAFALKDPRVGEEVGAAVVLRDGERVAESDLQLFVSRKLADFKVPRKIVFVAEIPKGPTGKLQRIGLAQKLLPEVAPETPPENRVFVAPQNETEVLVASIWRQVLSLDRVSTHDSFFDLGGDSSAAAQMLTRIEREFGQALAPAALFESPTIEQLAHKLRGAASMRTRVSSMAAGGPGKPFFCVHGHPLFFAWARHVAPERSFLSLLPPSAEELPEPFSLETLAQYHVKSIREMQPTGPYYLGGWCVEGVVAVEVARQLRDCGEEVGGLFLIDARNPRTRDLDAAQGGRPSFRTRLRYHQSRLRKLAPREWPSYFGQRWLTLTAGIKRRVWRSLYALGLLRDRRERSFSRDIDEIVALAVHSYQPSAYDGSVILIRPEDRARPRNEDPACGWRTLIPNLNVREVPGTHRTLFDEPNVAILASILCEMMDGDSSAAHADASAKPAEAAHAASAR
jgi:acyl-CoA synthetase (AMP-forming)/AMP-acid ligase II/thioesterase domain-containing protein/acyl carrier protein